jgi:hypothetical protein
MAPRIALAFGGGAEHAWEQQNSIQVGTGLNAFLGGRFAKGGEIRAQQRKVETAGSVGGALRRTSHIDVAAQHRPLDDGAHGVLERVQFWAQVKVQIQAAMIDALQADDDVAVFGALLDAGKAGHAADRSSHCLRFNVHGLTFMG